MKGKWIFLVLTILAALASGGIMIVTAQGPTPGGRRAPAVALGTAFTYQGQLKSGGALVNGNCDFQFGLWDSQSGGTQLGITQTLTATPVTNGLFTVQLNGGGQFGGSAFNGDARWLGIAVSCPSGGSYTTLSSRQQLTAEPYALYSLSAATAANFTGSLAGDVTGIQGNTTVTRLQARNVDSTAPTSGQVLTWNGTAWAPAAPVTTVVTPTLRKYYLSASTANGSQALNSCAVGYHMASLWEIFNVSGLLYDTSLGYTLSADQGSGPPSGLGGWIRTGGLSSTFNSPGVANCNAWTSNSGSITGITVYLTTLWGDRASSDTHRYVDPWLGVVYTCDNPIRVWCVQNLP